MEFRLRKHIVPALCVAAFDPYCPRWTVTVFEVYDTTDITSASTLRARRWLLSPPVPLTWKVVAVAVSSFAKVIWFGGIVGKQATVTLAASCFCGWVSSAGR